MAVRSLELKTRFFSKEQRSFDVKMLSMAPLPQRVKKITSNLHTAVVLICQFFQANTVTVLFEVSHDHFNSDDPKVFISFNVK
jgi:hypothetical protein